MSSLLPDNLVVVDPNSAGPGLSLSERLGVPCVDEADLSGWALVCTASGLELHHDGVVRIGATPDRHRQVSKRDPLGRAVGKDSHSVVDATAGLGGDTLLMLRMGFSVTAIERSPLVAVLLEDRLNRARFPGGPPRVLTGDAGQVLTELSDSPDTVYLDPMFPARRRSSALPRKELVALGELAEAAYGSTPDNPAELLATALDVARRRVVVKRLPESPDLGRPPHHSHHGKVVRYDVYLATTDLI